jgi:hypothetical protein
MKNASWCMVLLLVTGLMGCNNNTEKAPQDLLTVTKDRICLTSNQKESCMEGATGTWRLYMKDGKPVMEALETSKLLGSPNFSQFDRGMVLKGEQLNLVCNQKSLRLKDGEREYADSTGLGHLLMRDAKGQLWVMCGKTPKTKPVTYQWDPKGTLVNSRTSRIILEAGRPLQSWLYMTTIQFQYGDGANHYIPNDTGTEVVIIDNFHVEGNCNTAVPDDCCSGEEASPEQLEISEWVGEYAAEGQNLLACFNVNAICTFTDGDKLIVYVCESQERYCLDYSICDVSITTTDEGICFSVPTGCGMENPFD